jgi:hypothetical protein
MKFIFAFLLSLIIGLPVLAQDRFVSILFRNELLEVQEIQEALDKTDYVVYHIPDKPFIRITFKNPTTKTFALIKFLKANYGVGNEKEPGDHPTICEGDND